MTLSPVARAPVTPVWQNPYVEVIRYGLAHRSVGWQEHGEVEQATDAQIHKNVFKIRGAIASANYVRFPREVSKGHQGLGLTGRYVYIQLRRTRGHHVTLHLDLLTSKKTALRVSLSSMYSSLRSTGTVLRIPLELSEVWTTMAIDMVELLQFHTFNGYSREAYRYLKAVTCCTSMNLRNIITSSTAFTPQTLPTTLSLPVAHENQCGPYVWLVLPDPGQRKPLQSPAKIRSTAKTPGAEDGSHFFYDIEDGHSDSEEGGDGGEDAYGQGSEAAARAAVAPLPLSSRQTAQTRETLVSPKSPADPSGTGGAPLSPTSRESGLIRDRQDVLSRADQIMREAGFSVPSPRRSSAGSKPLPRTMKPAAGAVSQSHESAGATTGRLLSPRRFLASEQSDWPDPIVSLSRIIGFSTAFPKALRWLPDVNACVYTCHSTIVLRRFTAEHVARDSNKPHFLGSQHHQGIPTTSAAADAGTTLEDDLAGWSDDHETFLTGHTGEICAMEISRDGSLLASVQNSPQCVLRVWDLRDGKHECVLVLKAPTKTVHVLAFSPNGKSLCCVGNDDHARTQIFVWDCSGLYTATGGAATKKLALQARQTCDFPITMIAFSPYEADQLVSCGKENVRFWRIHAARHHLPGSPVILKEYSRGTVFTDLAFDCVYPQFPSNLPRTRPLYVSSSLGSVLVINYDSREVVCVYKLHDAPINALCVNEGFCVTGSDDKFLRVWPLDFSDFFLEAEHEASVKSVDVSTDGLRVAVGSSSGAIGVLHLVDQRYRTVLRSHTQPVHTMAPLPNGSLVTSALDGTLRVWDVVAGSQSMEFDVSRDQITCLAAMADSATIAVGFQSGCTRIFSFGDSTAASLKGLPPQQPRVEYEFQQHQSPLCDVVYQSDGKTLYTTGAGQQLCMYDATQAYAPVKMLIADMDASHGKLCLSRDRRFLAVLQQGLRSVLLLDAASLCVVCVLTPPQPTLTATSQSGGEDLELTHLVISWNSQELFVVSRADRLFVFSLAEQPQDSQRGFSTLLHSMPLLGQQAITSFALSPNLKYMATGGSDGSLRVWQCELGKQKFQRMHQTFVMNAGQGAVRGIVFSSSGDQVLAVSDNSSAVFVWRFRGNTSKLPVLELTSDSSTLHNTKAGFHLPLDGISNKEKEAAVPPSGGKSAGDAKDVAALVVETVQLNQSITRRVEAQWKHVLSAQATSSLCQCNAWSCALGCFIFAVDGDRVLVVERLDSGTQSFVSINTAVESVTLSPSQEYLALVPVDKDAVFVCDLKDICSEDNQTEENIAQITPVRVKLPHQLDLIHALELSIDNKLLFISGSIAGNKALFVVDIESRGAVVWHVAVPNGPPISGIVSQSPREFACVQSGIARPLHRLRIPPFSLSSVLLTLEPVLETSLPSPPQFVCFRDDGLTSALSSTGQPYPVRSRFAVAVDSEGYCFFIDLEQHNVLLTTQLILPSTSSRPSTRITSVEWVGTGDWQALVVGINDTLMAVYPLPSRVAFSSVSQTRVAVVDWAVLKRGGRLSSSHTMSFDRQRIARIFMDPLADVGLVLTEDGAAIVAQFRSAQQRILRPGRDQQLCLAAMPQSAANGVLLVTISSDCYAIQCWESTTGRELARLSVPGARCTGFTVNPFDSMIVAAGYDDDSIRIFHVGDQRLVTQCVLPPPGANPSRTRPNSSGRTPTEALSTLKQRQTFGGTRFPAEPTGGFQELRFIGSRCVLAITKALSPMNISSSASGGSGVAQRIVLFDFSQVAFTTPTVSPGAVKTSGGKPAKEKAIHYREIHLPPPTREMIRQIDSSSRTKGVNKAAWELRVESVDVQPSISRSSVKQASDESDVELPESTNAFVIVVRVGRGHLHDCVRIAHMYDGSEMSATGHPVFTEEEVRPCDSWLVESPSVVFHPIQSSQLLYAEREATADEAEDLDDRGQGQALVIRDFRARSPLLRLSIPRGIIDGQEALIVQRCRVGGKRLIMVSASAGASSDSLDVLGQFAVDLTKRVIFPVQSNGGRHVGIAGARIDEATESFQAPLLHIGSQHTGHIVTGDLVLRR